MINTIIRNKLFENLEYENQFYNLQKNDYVLIDTFYKDINLVGTIVEILPIDENIYNYKMKILNCNNIFDSYGVNIISHIQNTVIINKNKICKELHNYFEKKYTNLVIRRKTSIGQNVW